MLGFLALTKQARLGEPRLECQGKRFSNTTQKVPERADGSLFERLKNSFLCSAEAKRSGDSALDFGLRRLGLEESKAPSPLRSAGALHIASFERGRSFLDS